MVITRPNLRFEKELLRGGPARLAAMDEVGRGALAGPVTVGVVVVTASIGRVPPGLADSKLLTPAAREALVTPIKRWVTEFAVGHAGPEEIDSIGIIAALRIAGRRALAALSGPVDAVLLDGNHNYLSSPSSPCFRTDDPPLFDVAAVLAAPSEPAVHVRIKADLTCAAVAGASVLAKTERDRLLVKLSPVHPVYGFAENKGYGTPEHVAALREYGPSPVHRRSWRLPFEEPQLFCESTDLLVGPGG
jgi:ribonuclease HII